MDNKLEYQSDKSGHVQNQHLFYLFVVLYE